MSSFFVGENHRLPLSGMATVVCYLQSHFGISLASGGVLVGFGMVFAGDISDVMSDGEEQRRFKACEHKHTTSRFKIHLAKAELAVPFFCTEI